MRVFVSGRDVEVQLGDDARPYAPAETLTPLEAEKLVKDLRAAIDEARANSRPAKALGDY